MNKQTLTAGLNRCLDDKVMKVVKKTIMAYSNHDVIAANSVLDEWSYQGKLKIVTRLEAAGDNDVVVELVE